VSVAKFGINSLWKNFLRNDRIPTSAKYEVFYAASRALVCYASQIWGFERHECVEKLLRFFIKRLFCLPENTPIYLLHLETGITKYGVAYTLNLHFVYIKKIINLADGRWPKILLKETVKKNKWCFKSWKNMGEEF
jgi:hypothetical protein